MPDQQPNVLVIMTDEERYPPPYEGEAVVRWRRDALPARERLRARSVELHRHYTASTACIPSRASLFTGQYPSLHGVTQTDGLTKAATDPAMHWLDPDGVPTLGDWFRAAGYRTFYKGKWHISHADLITPGRHEGLKTNDADGNVFPEAVDAYLRADRLDPFGFSGWIGREPHGADPADTGLARDELYADQVTQLFDDLRADADGGPWLAVASFVNPHDIAFSGPAWSVFGFPPIPDDVPDVPEAPSQADALDDRPGAHEQFVRLWHEMLFPQPIDLDYRRLYLWLHQVVDPAIDRVLDGLAASGMEENTIVVFTSDHGDMLGAHGGLMQKWHNGFDEAIRVPLLVSGPGITPSSEGLHLPTSHTDLIPTLLGLAGVDVEAAAARVAERHVETHDLVGRDLSPLLRGSVTPADVDTPVYFMTDDQISRGLRQTGMFSGQPFEPVSGPDKVEAVIAHLPTGPDGADQLWKLVHYFDRLGDWEDRHALTQLGAPEPSDPEWELHCLTTDPEERTNLAARPDDAPAALGQMQALLHEQRDTKRLVPRLRNPA